MNRITDNDKNWGPFTLGRWRHNFSFRFSTGDEEKEAYRNHLMLVAFGWALRIALPNIVPPFRIRHEARWDEATVKRLGRNHYFVTHEREFGFTLSDMGNGYDFLQVFFGRQTNDSSTTRSWSKHLPWKQWDCVRYSFYNPDGSHFFTPPPKARFLDWYDKSRKCPAVRFEFEDFDGVKIIADGRVEEREWHRGTGWFKWLRFFYRPKIHRSLDLKFSAEVGPEKGSYKGGTTGHGIEMKKGETPEQAFQRYCEMEHRSKYKKFRIKFVGQCKEPAPI